MRTPHKAKSWQKPCLVGFTNSTKEPVFYPLCLEPVPGTKFQFTLINVRKNKRKTGISISIGAG
jgi:hypothetical protein